jgi:hypothetical protein
VRSYGTLAYGFCKVSIPEAHSFAGMERLSIWKFEFRPDPEKHLVLHKVEPESKDLFFKEVFGPVKSSPAKDVFVNSYRATGIRFRFQSLFKTNDDDRQY